MTNVTSIVSDFAFIALLDGPVHSKQYTIASSSLTDVSDLVQTNGSITVTAPTVEGATSYFLMASYYSRSYSRACVPSNPNPQNILQNGSFAVDHFSPVGAQLTTNFLEEHILVEGILDLIREVGNYIWEDSVEIPGMVYWTPNLTDAFQDQHGVSSIYHTEARPNGSVANCSSTLLRNMYHYLLERMVGRHKLRPSGQSFSSLIRKTRDLAWSETGARL